MPTIIKKQDIISILDNIDVVEAMEKGFIAYSNNQTVVPPVAELLFDKPKGETHIKYGYIKNDDYYVIKIASGFYENPKIGLSSSQGMMLLFSQKTGEIKAILLDEGHLTNIRTAAAGALSAKYFAAKNIEAIGIVGCGIQGRLQLEYLQKHNPCKTVWIWDLYPKSAEKYMKDFNSKFDIHIAKSTAELAQHCNLIVTSTPSEAALLKADDIQAGTHITAVGSDTSDKQELDSAILQKADIVIADSIEQSNSRGEIYRARKNGMLADKNIIELGKAIQDKSLQRTNNEQITVVDLTGVAVQDIMIAKAVYEESM